MLKGSDREPLGFLNLNLNPESEKSKKSCFATSIYVHYRESQKHENWKTTWGLVSDVLERRKGYSINPNTWKICVKRLEFYSSSLTEFIHEGGLNDAKKSACLMFSGTPCTYQKCHGLISVISNFMKREKYLTFLVTGYVWKIVQNEKDFT